MPRRSRNRAEDRLAQLEAKLAAERARRLTCVPYYQRMHNHERWTLLTQRLLEADAMQAEGAPPEKVVAARIEANERFRWGDVQYEAMKKREAKLAAEAAAVAPVPAVAPKVGVPHEPRERRPKPKERDVLADYRDKRGQAGWHPRLEPEYV